MPKLNKALQAVVAGMAGKVYLIDLLEAKGIANGMWSPYPPRANQAMPRTFLGICPRKKGACFKYDVEWRVHLDAAYVRQKYHCALPPEEMLTETSHAPFDECRHSDDFSRVVFETATGRITYKLQP